MNLLLPASPLKITVEMNGRQIWQQALSYGAHTDYIKVSPGDYHVKIQQESDLVLDRALGMGKKSSYLLIVSGVVPNDLQTNQQTTKTKLLDFFEGSTASSANGNLPILTIIPESFNDDPSKAQLSAVNLVPGLTAQDFNLQQGGSYQSVFTLEYPLVSTRAIALNPGDYRLQVRNPQSGLPAATSIIHLLKQVKSTVILAPIPTHFSDSLSLFQLDTH